MPQKVLRDGILWKDRYFYQKAEALYRLTYVFCRRYLPRYGDRTVDRMIQAARSGKQNIVEGLEDSRTSTEMELRRENATLRAELDKLRSEFATPWDTETARDRKSVPGNPCNPGIYSETI